MFDDFDLLTIDTDETSIRVRRGGSGPPVLLLHGIPETHLMWHRVAPDLARDFTVVAADLRGYGDSGKPPTTADHAPYSKRALARDQVAVMRKLGFEEFFVVGHDRGARCAYRLALDHPERVRKLAVLDIVPTGEAFRRANMEFGLTYWIWLFLAQPADFPERAIGANPRLFVDYMLDVWSNDANAFPPAIRDVYVRAFEDPATVHAICEEYRAASTLDYRHDEADRGTRRIECPLLVLWSKHSAFASWYDPLDVWRGWATDVRGRALDCGHFIPEEAPDETIVELRRFLLA